MSWAEGDLHERAIELLPRVLSGDVEAWRAMWRLLAPPAGTIEGLARATPHVRNMARAARIGPLRHSPEHLDNIVLTVMGKLRNDDFRALRQFAKKHADDPGYRFPYWLTRVVQNAAYTYRASLPEARAGGDRAEWAILCTLIPSMLAGERPQLTRAQIVARLLDLARDELTPTQMRAVEAWLTLGDSKTIYDEVARECGLSGADDAQRAVRAGLERLRRAYRNREGSPGRVAG